MNRLSVAIPASVVSDTPHLREKTGKLGAIARAASIFGVDEIILYPDDPKVSQEVELAFCADILRYLETPQYLRKRLFKLRPEFRYTGVLPPLQTPPHNVPRTMSAVKAGDLREGVVVSSSSHKLTVDVGLEETILVAGNHAVGERVTVRIVRVSGALRGETVDVAELRGSTSGEVSNYLGYQVAKAKSLGVLLRGQPWDLRLGTSRYGIPIHEVLSSISEAMKRAESTVIAFGSPKLGLKNILAEENISPAEAFQYFINTAPNQQTMTVRTEEALLISLGIFNLARIIVQ